MVELFIVACLLGEPATCERFFVPFERPMPLARCLGRAQLRAVQWSRSHPEWTVKGWICAVPEA